MRRNTFFAALGGLFLVFAAFWFVNMSRGGAENPDKLDDETAGVTAASAPGSGQSANDPARRCASQRTYDLVGRELFRQAAARRGSDAATFERLATYAAVRVSAPLVRRQDEGLDTTVCSGTVTIDLPPGVQVTGGRRSLSATVDYALQPAADGTGDVVTLSGAESIVVLLATLTRTSDIANSAVPATEPAVPDNTFPTPDIGPPDVATRTVPAASPPPPPARPAPSATRPAPAPVRAAPAASRVIPPSPRAPGATASANPSFNCRNARTFGERAVCGDSGLASLDRRMASQFNRAAASAGPGERALLNRTRGRFLGYRDACRSDDCIADAYRGRMREIDDIMSGRLNN